LESIFASTTTTTTDEDKTVFPRRKDLWSVDAEAAVVQREMTAALEEKEKSALVYGPPRNRSEKRPSPAAAGAAVHLDFTAAMGGPAPLQSA